MPRAKRTQTPLRGTGYPYFRCWGNDWLASATRARLTPEQRGAFWDLICYAWNTPDCTLPTDPAVLAAYSGLNGRWAEVGEPLMAIAFKKSRDRYINVRLQKERGYVDDRSLKARRAGLKSGRARR